VKRHPRVKETLSKDGESHTRGPTVGHFTKKGPKKREQFAMDYETTISQLDPKFNVQEGGRKRGTIFTVGKGKITLTSLRPSFFNRNYFKFTFHFFFPTTTTTHLHISRKVLCLEPLAFALDPIDNDRVPSSKFNYCSVSGTLPTGSRSRLVEFSIQPDKLQATRHRKWDRTKRDQPR
jgi:hypothetical protein